MIVDLFITYYTTYGSKRLYHFSMIIMTHFTTAGKGGNLYHLRNRKSFSAMLKYNREDFHNR